MQIIKDQLSFALARDDKATGVLAMTGQTVDERVAVYMKRTKAQLRAAIELRESQGKWTGVPTAECVPMR